MPCRDWESVAVGLSIQPGARCRETTFFAPYQGVEMRDFVALDAILMSCKRHNASGEIADRKTTGVICRDWECPPLGSGSHLPLLGARRIEQRGVLVDLQCLGLCALLLEVPTLA